MRRIFAVSAAVAAFAVAACNTLAGTGRDVGGAGHVVSATAHEAETR